MMETIAVGCREEVNFGLEPEAKAGLCLQFSGSIHTTDLQICVVIC